MPGKVTVLGVHQIEADQSVHLIEILVEGDVEAFDFGDVTQEDLNQPRNNWQVAYDEQPLEESEDKARFVFFFHYLDLKKPLLTSFGPVSLSKTMKVPAHLKHITYEAP